MTFSNEGFSDGGVLSVFGLNCAIAAALVIVFSIIRRKKDWGHLFGYEGSTSKDGFASLSEPVNSTDETKAAAGPVNKVLEFGGVLSWLGTTIRVTEDQLMQRCGFDAMIYLRFQRQLVILTFMIAVLCGGVLVPINDSGNANYDHAKANDLPYWSGFDDWTTANLEKKDDKLWAHCAVFVIISCAFYSFVAKFLLNFDKSRREWQKSRVDNEVKDFAVMIRRLPLEMRDKQYLIDHVNTYLYPGALVECQLFFEMEEMRDLVTKREKLQDLYDHYQKVAKEEGERPMIRAGVKAAIGKVDAIEHFAKELADLDKKLLKQRKRKDHPTTSVAVVTFADKKTQKLCIQNFSFKREETSMSGIAEPIYTNNALAKIGGAIESVGASALTTVLDGNASGQGSLPPTRWQVLPAPRPDHIVWQNLDIPDQRRIVRRVLFQAATFWIVLFSATLIGFLGSLTNLASIPVIGEAFKWMLDLPPTTQGFITAYLPTLVVVAFNIAVPILMRLFATQEGIINEADIDKEVMAKIYTFMVFATVILPSVVIGGMGALSTLAKDFADKPFPELLNLLTRVVSPKSGVFIALLIQNGLTSTFLTLLRAGPLIGRFIALKSAVTDKDKKEAEKCPPFPFFANYPFLLLMLTITMFFSVTMPLTPVFGFIYFAMKYICDKYALYYVNPKPPPADGRMTAKAMTTSLVILASSQVAAAGIFAGKEAIPQFVIAVVFFALTVFFLTYIGTGIEEIFKQDSWIPDIDPERENLTGGKTDPETLASFREAYLHPALEEIPTLGDTIDEDDKDGSDDDKTGGDDAGKADADTADNAV